MPTIKAIVALIVMAVALMATPIAQAGPGLKERYEAAKEKYEAAKDTVETVTDVVTGKTTWYEEFFKGWPWEEYIIALFKSLIGIPFGLSVPGILAFCALLLLLVVGPPREMKAKKPLVYSLILAPLVARLVTGAAEASAWPDSTAYLWIFQLATVASVVILWRRGFFSEAKEAFSNGTFGDFFLKGITPWKQEKADDGTVIGQDGVRPADSAPAGSAKDAAALLAAGDTKQAGPAKDKPAAAARAPSQAKKPRPASPPTRRYHRSREELRDYAAIIKIF